MAVPKSDQAACPPRRLGPKRQRNPGPGLRLRRRRRCCRGALPAASTQSLHASACSALGEKDTTNLRRSAAPDSRTTFRGVRGAALVRSNDQEQPSGNPEQAIASISGPYCQRRIETAAAVPSTFLAVCVHLRGARRLRKRVN